MEVASSPINMEKILNAKDLLLVLGHLEGQNMELGS